jgi:processive 1,2-diacylglycerol beta-glucosyltransferase
MAHENSEKPLIIALYSSVGSGHRSAAASVAEAFELLRGKHPLVPEDVEIELLDILDFGFIKFDGEKTTRIFTGPTRYIYDITWYYVLTGRFLWGGGTVWSHVMFKPFTRYVEKRKPLAIVSTHIVSANAAVAARMITGQNYPIVSVPTDYGVEGLWPHRTTDVFCVADNLMEQELYPRKVAPENIKVTGIPVRPSFNRTYNRQATLEEFGLPQDKKIVLVIAGARLRGPYVLFRQVMNEVLEKLGEFENMHFVFLPGSDEEYANQLRTECKQKNLNNISVFDYVENIAALMNAAHLAVAKSGGLAVTECLCSKLPLVIVGRSFGQERANTTTVTRAGAAVQVLTAQDLLAALQSLGENPQQLDAMVEAGAQLSRPDSAEQVALATLDKVGKTTPFRKKFMHFYWGEKPLRIR